MHWLGFIILLVYKAPTRGSPEVQSIREPEMHLQERSTDSCIHSTCIIEVGEFGTAEQRKARRVSSGNMVATHNENQINSEQLKRNNSLTAVRFGSVCTGQ